MEFRYDDLVCKNWPLITRSQQEKLKNTRLLIAGCGTGSVIAEAAIRLGFERLVLVDGDNVELKNINRQAYVFADVGKNKTQVLKRRLLRINSSANITAFPRFLDSDNVVSLVHKSDVIIDGIDVIDLKAIISLHREARRQGKSIATGFNFGWGGVGIVFTPDSVSLEEMLGSYLGVPTDELLRKSVTELIVPFEKYIPQYFLDVYSALPQRGRPIKEIVAEIPQPVVAALQCSTLVAMAAMRVALGLPTAVAPKLIYFDPWVAFEPE